jgi:hypothetical protein
VSVGFEIVARRGMGGFRGAVTGWSIGRFDGGAVVRRTAKVALAERSIAAASFFRTTSGGGV